MVGFCTGGPSSTDIWRRNLASDARTGEKTEKSRERNEETMLGITLRERERERKRKRVTLIKQIKVEGFPMTIDKKKLTLVYDMRRTADSGVMFNIQD